MSNASKRVTVLQNHLCKPRSVQCSSDVSPTISVTPAKALVDQKVTITLSGLQPNQLVTLVAYVEENAVKFESRAVYRADESGCIDSSEAYSLAGSFIGKEPMGLFWSMKPEVYGTRFMKKDVSVPSKVNIRVFDGVQEEGACSGTALVSTCAERMFMGPGVRRIKVKVGRIRGTVFVPEGQGPFPAVIDTYGSLATLIEVRAALLASYGYATFALSYLHANDSNILKYVKAAVDWFRDQDYVDGDRLGLLGLCYGGLISLHIASLLPEIKAVVNVSGMPINHGPEVVNMEFPFVYKDFVDDRLWQKTDEGLVLRDVWKMENKSIIKAWRHGAKVLLIAGGDDLQVDPKWHHHAVEKWPPEYRCNMRSLFYPGAGHLIEFPYIPNTRTSKPGRKRMLDLGFIPEEYADEYVMSGGFPQQHAHAQEDAWRNILDFLESSLRR